MSPRTSTYNALNLPFCEDCGPTIPTQQNELKYQTLDMNTLENAGWYVTLTILTTNIREGIHTDNISLTY